MPETAQTATLTSYVILEQLEVTSTSDEGVTTRGPDIWKRCGVVKARSAHGALRAFNDIGEGLLNLPEGVYVAIPARSWNPVTVAVETQTKITLS